MTRIGVRRAEGRGNNCRVVVEIYVILSYFIFSPVLNWANVGREGGRDTLGVKSRNEQIEWKLWIVLMLLILL